MHKPLLKDKRILVTAGPTWVPIDAVRVISNISSGLTGITIAKHAAKMGADVTLLLGPVSSAISSPLSAVSLKILRFRYFDELQKLIVTELRRRKYDILIQAAAISDYKPASKLSKKIKSGRSRLVIRLKPTAKIVGSIRRYARDIFLVMFKLEVGRPRGKLIKMAYEGMRRFHADLVVANNIDEISEKRHVAYIIDLNRKVTRVETKTKLAETLLGEAAKRL
jgi:phosphopantothenoylcysteine synthetase/decarboxylase